MKIIGDIHGKLDEYIKIVSNTKSSVQLGDFGFSNVLNNFLYYQDMLPCSHHKIGAGNHSDHDMISNIPHYLGRFGRHLIDNIDFFWIDGALSIDLVYRVGEWMSNGRIPLFKSWWSNEQLDYFEMVECKAQYELLRPSIVLSHTCPSTIINSVNGNKSSNIMYKYGWGSSYNDMTSQFLQTLLEKHQPELWVFGHHHKSFDMIINGTRFICLEELGTYEI